MTREETNQRKAREGENKGKGEEERNMVKKKKKKKDGSKVLHNVYGWRRK